MIKNEPVYINGDGETNRDFRAGDVIHSLADIVAKLKNYGVMNLATGLGKG